MTHAIEPGEGLREVAIFRHNLFRISEPFIAEQAQHLRRYRPFYVGRKRFGLPPEGASSFAPSLIHAHFGIEGVAALALRLEIPLVTTFHGFDATLEMHAMLGSPAWF